MYSYIYPSSTLNVGRGLGSTLAVGTREAVHSCSHPRSTGEDAVAGETAENLVKIAIADFLQKVVFDLIS